MFPNKNRQIMNRQLINQGIFYYRVYLFANYSIKGINQLKNIIMLKVNDLSNMQYFAYKGYRVLLELKEEGFFSQKRVYNATITINDAVYTHLLKVTTIHSIKDDKQLWQKINFTKHRNIISLLWYNKKLTLKKFSYGIYRFIH